MASSITASELFDWRSRMAWSQSCAAGELQIELEDYIVLEAGCATASKRLLKLAASLETRHSQAAPATATTLPPVAD